MKEKYKLVSFRYLYKEIAILRSYIPIYDLASYNQNGTDRSGPRITTTYPKHKLLTENMPLVDNIFV